ncbi:phosphoribosylamine--glycine ligase [Candidatus Gottesmanbacteria bacterium]|nr:phosphoribosylamine--glycine ligase [Candidatus Gottesmanbacteria bacterium]
MKILVIGSGGREHALIWKIAMSPKVKKIYCAPGNLGIETVKLGSGLKVAKGLTPFVENIPIQVHELDKLVKFAKEKKIDLTIVGPEAPLIFGIADLFARNNLPIIGPAKKAAQIEGSKVFAKELMAKYGIPTAKFAVFDSFHKAKLYIEAQKFPLVIKAEGQCFGKGVSVCQNKKEANKFLENIFKKKIFDREGKRIVIEECLEGQEVSFMLATDGKDFVSLLPSQDHKRVNDCDRGPNTGGMGAYAPVPFVDKKLIKRIEKEIVIPALRGMQKEGCQYKGILYPGLIITRDGPKVLEFNCRFGDPETQPLMMLLKTDIVDLFEALVDKKLKNYKLKWYKGAAVCVVLTAKGYPGEYEKGKIIYGLPKPFARGTLAKAVMVFHSGTKILNGKLVTLGGRVLGVTARGKNLKDAIKNVYKYIGKKGVYFPGMHYRKDIGKKAVV